jgi:GNAT superfamily N-acetyltransferase
VTMQSSIQIHAVDCQRWQEVQTLFHGSPMTSGCWCMWPRCTPRSFRPSPVEKQAFYEVLSSGRMPGFIAVDDSTPVAWCAVGQCHEFPQYQGSGVGPEAWVVPCLFVAPSGRRIGLGPRMIRVAAEYAISHGAEDVFGPAPWWNPGSVSAAKAVVAAFEANGFQVVHPGARVPMLRMQSAESSGATSDGKRDGT